MGGKLVVVGASSGGVHALPRLLSGLPRNLGAPVAVVLHRGEAGNNLARCLQLSSLLPVREAEDKDDLRTGSVYIAPAGYHLLVEEDALALSTEAPVAWARPSIDVLFESAADAWKERTIGVILTGANADGAHGLARIKQNGGLTIVQEPSGAEYSTMPRAAIAASHVDHILSLEEVARLLARICPRLG